MKTTTTIARERRKRDDAYAASTRKLAELIETAHSEGATWAEIADAMDMTRQGLGLFRIKNGAPRDAG